MWRRVPELFQKRSRIDEKPFDEKLTEKIRNYISRIKTACLRYYIGLAVDWSAAKLIGWQSNWRSWMSYHYHLLMSREKPSRDYPIFAGPME